MFQHYLGAGDLAMNNKDKILRPGGVANRNICQLHSFKLSLAVTLNRSKKKQVKLTFTI